MEHIDQELSKIEAELVTILRVSTLVLDSKETPKNLKVQQTQEILESICGMISKEKAKKLTIALIVLGVMFLVLLILTTRFGEVKIKQMCLL